jgi:hypothetical protein
MTRSVHLLSIFFVTIIEVPDLIIPTYKHCVKFVVVMMVVHGDDDDDDDDGDGGDDNDCNDGGDESDS